MAYINNADWYAANGNYIYTINNWTTGSATNPQFYSQPPAAPTAAVATPSEIDWLKGRVREITDLVAA